MEIFPPISDAMPVGAICQGLAPMSAKWLHMDGATHLRSAYPDLSAMVPANPLTWTQRTLPAAPAVGAVGAANANLFVLPSALGVTGIQTSPDGVTWTPRNTPVACGLANIIWTGTRFVAVNTETNKPLVSTDGITWTETTNGVGGLVGAYSLAYSASLGLTVLVDPNNTTSIYTLADGSTDWQTRTAPAMTSRGGVVWTGTRFVAFSHAANAYTIQVSTDGVTWTDQALLDLVSQPANSGAGACVASNGAGTIVWAASSGTISLATVNVSLDHGATWRGIHLPTGAGYIPSHVRYVNGRFFVFGMGTIWSSLDGLVWACDYTRAVSNPYHYMPVAYRAGVYLCAPFGLNTTTYTATEDATRFRVPFANRMASGAHVSPYPYFIKAVR